MRKSALLLVGLFLTIVVIAQKKLPNPTIGNSESEISLFVFQDRTPGWGNYKTWGLQTIYRFQWKEFTKVGLGGLISADYNEYYGFTHDVYPYGALFADIVQFIGKRQKWNFEGQIGHGIYKQEYQFDESAASGFNKYSAGMYYSISVGYRAVVSKKIVAVFSPIYFFRNYRHVIVVEYHSPSSIERMEDVAKHQGFGLKIGIVF
jgi:hypothetical protein